MKSPFPWTILASALLLSCSTKDENTLVGSDFFGRRGWAVPAANDSLTVIRRDTYYEGSLRPGTQKDLLLGARRKFRFWTAVYFDTLPGREDSLVGAVLTASARQAEGAATVRIDRVLEEWTESSGTESLTTGASVEVPLDGELSAEIPIEWVRAWIDSSDKNNGVLLRIRDEDEAFFRFSSREADSTEYAGRFRLHVTVADSSGADSTVVSGARLDRFYAFKTVSGSYVEENMSAETLLVGMRESLTNQMLFEILFPDTLADVTVNKAELVLTVADAALDPDAALVLEAIPVANDTLAADSIVVQATLLGRVTVSPDAAPGDTVAITMTSAVRTWFADREWVRRMLVHATVEQARDFYLRFHANEEAVPPPLRPRFRLLYTPLRPENAPRPGTE